MRTFGGIKLKKFMEKEKPSEVTNFSTTQLDTPHIDLLGLLWLQFEIQYYLSGSRRRKGRQHFLEI